MWEWCGETKCDPDALEDCYVDFRDVELERLAITASARSAVFTDAALGKKSATSGSIMTILDLFCRRRAYFPRTNAPKSALLYSDRNSPGFLLVLFIKCSLFPRCLPSTDDSNGAFPFSMGDNQEPSAR